MQQPYFELTVPVFIRQLHTVRHLLRKGDEYARSIGMSEADFLASRLAPDMFPLVKQVQMVTDNAKGSVARLAGVTPLSIADTEATVAELLSRLDTVIAHLETFTPEQFSDAANREITLPYFPGTYFKGSDFLVEYALPNFYFHISMVYAIVRQQGAPLGKADFLGQLSLQKSA